MPSDQLFDYIQMIGFCKKRTEKEALLQTPPVGQIFLLKRVLYQTYNPFIRYGFRKMPFFVGSSKREQFSERTWKLLQVLADGTLSGNNAKETVSTYLGLLTPKSSELFQRILLKDLKIGVSVKTINKVFPNLIPEHNVMLCEEWREDKLKLPAIIQPKHNGNRGTLRIKKGKIYGRAGRFYKGLNHIVREVRKHNILHDLDGELGIPGVGFTVASGRIRDGNAVPNAVLTAFDLPDHGGRYIERVNDLLEICKGLIFVRAVHSQIVLSLEEVYHYHETFTRWGYEGSVVKSLYHEYQIGYSFDWMKLVDEKSVDLKVIGTYRTPKRDALGQAGGVIVYYHTKPVKIGGGFSHDMLTRILKDPDYIIGSTIRILYKAVTPDGSLQHPRFDRIRHDK